MKRKVDDTINDVFSEYADFYDLFYQEKDYVSECSYILNIIEKYMDKPVRSLLDIGCGTGSHALIWARKGIDVAGIDRSPEMLGHALKKARELNLRVKFFPGNIRNFQIKKKYDVITAMFAVMSYQTVTHEVLDTLNSVRGHLKRGGLFLFDIWSGPGVLSDPPREKVNSYRKGEIEILRIVKPIHNILKHTVDVHYDILCIKKNTIIRRIREVHPIRYFFPQEIDDIVSRCGFKLITIKPFMKQSENLTLNDWNTMVVLRGI
jgi:SAM-dependent methyltransferase